MTLLFAFSLESMFYRKDKKKHFFGK